MAENRWSARCVRCPQGAPLVPSKGGELIRLPGEEPYVVCALHALIERVPSASFLERVLSVFPRPDPINPGGVIAPYPYQVEDARRAATVRALLVGSQQGTGKAIVGSLGALRSDCGNMIFCPTSVKWNWEREIQRWRPDLKPIVAGSKTNWELPAPGEVVIGSWGLLPGDPCGACQEKNWRACVHEKWWVVVCGAQPQAADSASDEAPAANGKKKKQRRRIVGHHHHEEAAQKQAAKANELGSDLWSGRRGCGRPDCTRGEHTVEEAELPNPLPVIDRPLVLVADEVQYLQNKTARRRRWDLLRDRVWAAGGRLYGLTGTIVSNSPRDLWEILCCLKLERAAFPGGLEQFESIFGEWFLRAKGDRASPTGEARRELLEALRPVRICRLRRHVLKHLPPLVEKVVRVDLDKNTTAEVDEAVQKLLAVRRAWQDVEAGIVEDPWAKALSPDEKLRRRGKWDERVAFYYETRPWVTDLELREAVTEALNTRHETPSITELSRIRAMLALAKLTTALEIVEKHEREEEPMLVFCQHVGILKKLLGERAGWGLYHGGVPQRARDELIQAFQRADVRHGLGISITAGGEGINLTRAGSMLFVDAAWNPAKNDQAAARVQRPGAEVHESIMLWRLIANHAVDRLLMVTLREKGALHVAVEDEQASLDGLAELERVGVLQ